MHTAATRDTSSDPRRGPRRRGDALCRAIQEAVVAELARNGFAGLSVEHVAERAHTGKASIYRRWPTKVDLVVDALDQLMPSPQDIPDTGSVRGDLLALLRHVAAAMSAETGAAARACLTTSGLPDDLTDAVRERLLEPRRRWVTEILERGAARGEVRPDAVTPRVAEVGPMLLHGEVLQRGLPIADAAIVSIVDDVLMPLLRPA